MAERRPAWGAAGRRRGGARVVHEGRRRRSSSPPSCSMRSGRSRIGSRRRPAARLPASTRPSRAARWRWLTLAGLGRRRRCHRVCFVLPHWTEYQFYNWQMTRRRASRPTRSSVSSIARRGCRSCRTLHADVARARSARRSAIAGIVSALADGATGRTAAGALGARRAARAVVHDSGNERRYVMFVPALDRAGGAAGWLRAALAAGRLAGAPAGGHGCSRRRCSLLARLPGDRQRCCGRAFVDGRRWPGDFRCRCVWLSAGRRPLCAALLLAAGAGHGWLARAGGAAARRGRVVAGDSADRLEPAGSTPTGRAHRTRAQLRASVALGAVLRAGHARAGQARERPGARKPHPAALRRPRLRQLRRPARARRCALYTDVRLADESDTKAQTDRA